MLPMSSHTAFSPKCFAALARSRPSTSFKHGANKSSPVVSLRIVPLATMIQSRVTETENI
jgi:hypothetical protein